MSYQQHTGYTPVVSGVPAASYPPTSYGQPPMFPPATQPNNPFTLKASVTRKLGKISLKSFTL